MRIKSLSSTGKILAPTCFFFSLGSVWALGHLRGSFSGKYIPPAGGWPKKGEE